MTHRHWHSKRTWRDAPYDDDPWQTQMEAWAEGYNAAVAAYVKELNETLEVELGRPTADGSLS